MKNIFAWLLCITIAGCSIKHKEVEQSDVKFKTTDASLLFFKNVRQLYYDREHVAAGEMDIYRISRRSHSKDHAVINLAIANNWRHDEAYLLVEPNDLLADLNQLQVEWSTPSGDTSGLYTFAYGSKINHFTFANQLHKSILEEHSLKIRMNDSTSVSLLEEPVERDAFRKTMLDYYRLVELDR